MSDNDDDRTAAAARTRAKHRKKLSPKGKRATKQAAALSTKLRKGLRSPDPSALTGLAPEVARMHATLDSMRRELSRAHDPRSKAAARGIKDLQTSINRLAKASSSHSDPAHSSQLLYGGFKALERAEREARKAGHAWPL